ncbi:MAG TPA: hypothetical protein VJJ27_01780 [Candidatus Paceibacterota bacterium]
MSKFEGGMPPLNEWDPSLPHFHYPEDERQRMKEEKGKTEQEIREEEERITNLQAQKAVEDERRVA